jgi:hypothetical protein
MSQLSVETTTIDGHKYEMFPLPPSLSMDLLTDLVAAVSPVISPILSAVFKGKGGEADKEVLDREVSPDMFSKAITNLNASNLKDVRKALVSNFEKVTTRDGAKLENVVERVYMGNIGEMLQWLAWGCKVQWGKSLSGLMSAHLSKAMSVINPPSPSQST